jgi:D-arabinose 1-dehydrogenase-like Zn-dependent alcohol dehydrogenase
LFCGGVTAYSALLRVRASPGQLINIIGCGGVGASRFSNRVRTFIAELKSYVGHLAIMFAKKMGYRVHACKIFASICKACSLANSHLSIRRHIKG